MYHLNRLETKAHQQLIHRFCRFFVVLEQSFKGGCVPNTRSDTPSFSRRQTIRKEEQSKSNYDE
jgi:hypothetical protein